MDKPTKNKNLQTANDKELRPFRERKVSSQVFWQLLRQGQVSLAMMVLSRAAAQRRVDGLSPGAAWIRRRPGSILSS